MYLMTLEESENKTYLFFINQGWLLDRASWALDRDLDKDRCIEILTNIVTMVNDQLEDGIVKQATENTQQQIIDFALDSVGVVAGLVGMDEAFADVSNDVIQKIPLITGVAADTLDLTVDSIEELELLNQILGDYTMQYDFLNAVAAYSNLESMREAAQTILKANEQILLYKLDAFASASEATTKFLAKDIFIDKVAEEMLKDPSNFSSESTMFAASLAVGAHKIVASANLAFDLTILIGDGLFGTSNTYQQYNEMKAMRDIRGALIEYIGSNPITDESDIEQMAKNIELLKILQYVDAWGETCVYTTVKNEGTFIGDIWPRDTSVMDDNYQNSIAYFSSRVELLNSIYVDTSPVMDNTPPKIITEADRLNALNEAIEKKSNGHCKWLAEGDFNDDGTSEIYALICDAEKNYENGAVWYYAGSDQRCLFWLTAEEVDLFLGIAGILSPEHAVKAIDLAEYVFDILADF